jgi:hypothetical protein
MPDEFEKTVFVKIDNYEKVLTKVNTLNQNLKAAKSILDEIKDIKKDEEAEMNSWDKELEIMIQKVEYITKTMARSG